MSSSVAVDSTVISGANNENTSNNKDASHDILWQLDVIQIVSEHVPGRVVTSNAMSSCRRELRGRPRASISVEAR